MKRTIALILAAVLLLSLASCGKKNTEPTVAPTTEPTTAPTTETTIPAPTEPEWEPGVARAQYGEVVYTVLEKGVEVNILGTFKDYYVIEGVEADLLIEQRFARLNADEPFEVWEGYARSNREVYDNVYRRGEPIAALKLNQKVEVLEGKGDWLYIRWDDQEGYVLESDISKNRIATGGGGGGSTGGGGGPVDGTGFDFGSLSYDSGDGKVMLLGAYFGPEMDQAEEGEEEAFAPGMGKVLAHDIEAYIALAMRGDELKVTEYTDETVTVWLADEFYGTLPRWLVQLEGDEPYEAWTGYCKSKSVVYEEYQMRNELESPKVNTEVTVLDMLPECYVVQLEDGTIGYMKLDDVSETKVATGGGGYSGGSSSGGGAVWTPAVM